jgi:hypothetical protein
MCAKQPGPRGANEKAADITASGLPGGNKKSYSNAQPRMMAIIFASDEGMD